MWRAQYQERLESWVNLRDQVSDLPLVSCLDSIQNWWQASPWRPYYLHWDDRASWPDPWQLLAENIFCDIARALGMLYTVHMLDRPDCLDVQMVQAEQGNLVLVQQGKYIMNWTSDGLVNIPSKQIKIQTVLEPAVLASIAR